MHTSYCSDEWFVLVCQYNMSVIEVSNIITTNWWIFSCIWFTFLSWWTRSFLYATHIQVYWRSTLCVFLTYLLLYISSLNSPLIVFERVHATSFQLICDRYKILPVIVSVMLMQFTRMKEDIHNMFCLFKVDPESPPDLTHLLVVFLPRQTTSVPIKIWAKK